MQPAQTTPLQVPTPPPPPAQDDPAGRQGMETVRYEVGRQRQHRYQAAGVPVWGVLLILIGVVALFGNLGIGLGWIFGLALGSWFVYLGARPVQEGEPINWWLVALGLLIGLGAISSGFLDKLIFPTVLVLVGLGILGEYIIHH